MIFNLSSCVILTKQPVSNNFYLTFGSCFDNDTINVKINGSSVIDNLTLNSDFSTGIDLETGIKYVNGQLIIGNDHERISKTFKLEKSFKVTLISNSKESTFDINLRKGQYLIVDGCNSEGFKISQYKNPIVVE